MKIEINFNDPEGLRKQQRELEMALASVKAALTAIGSPAEMTSVTFVQPDPKQFEDFKLHDYDWDYPDTYLAAKHKVNIALVKHYRKLYGRPKLAAVKTLQVTDWRAVDWSAPSTEISAKYHVDIATVNLIRRRLRISTPRRNNHQRKVSDEMIKAVDWAVTRDMDIAGVWGVSRERVRQIRAVKGLPKTPPAWMSNSTAIGRFGLFVEANKDRLKGMAPSEVAALYPEEIRTRDVLKVLRRFGEHFNLAKKLTAAPFTEYPINWNLPNIVLNAVWQLGRSFSQHRYEMRVGQPAYHAGGRSLSCLAGDADFVELVVQEIRTARAHGRVPDMSVLAKHENLLSAIGHLTL